MLRILCLTNCGKARQLEKSFVFFLLLKYLLFSRAFLSPSLFYPTISAHKFVQMQLHLAMHILFVCCCYLLLFGILILCTYYVCCCCKFSKQYNLPGSRCCRLLFLSCSSVSPSWVSCCVEFKTEKIPSVGILSGDS